MAIAPTPALFAIPRSVVRKIMRESIELALSTPRDGALVALPTTAKLSNMKVSRAAFLIAHHEAEKFIEDIFKVSHEMCQATKKKTLKAAMMKAAIRCHRVLVPRASS